MAGPAGQPGLGCQDTSTTLLGPGAGEATRAGAPSVQGLGLPAPPRAGGCPRPNPQPGAVRPQPRRGGCSCARERGLPPRQLRRAPGSREDHLFPAPLAPRSVQPGCVSPAAAGVLAAAAPDGPLPPQTEPPRRAEPSLRPARALSARTPPPPAPQPGCPRDRARAPPPAGHALRPRPLRAPRARSAAAPHQANGLASGPGVRGLSEGGERTRDSKPRPLPHGPRRAHSPSPASTNGPAARGWQGWGCRAERGHWLPRRDPRWAAAAHWLVPSVRWTGERPRPPSRPRPRCSGCWSPGGGRRPSWSGGLWPSFGHLSHLSVPVQDWQGAGGLPGGPQSVRGSRGGAAVARGGQSQATELWLRLGRPKAVVCTGPRQTTAQPSLPTAPSVAGAPGWGRGRR